MKYLVTAAAAIVGAAVLAATAPANAAPDSPSGGTAHSAPAPAARDTPALSRSELSAIVQQREAALRAQLRALQNRTENIDVTHMFDMQLLMSQLSQLSEIPPGLVSGANGGVASPARGGQR
ncbi:DUF5407 family protein [Mycolicibacterium pallens]|uniref:DUF5407 domain-containing protein n=1 Tax=Mycolicibacterium pallens TaxID=370524 RepID=A0ABX8VEG5_9MYCO|nr:DUF5407 family protein [Mycolicibacterium pallens]QYL16183.1 DUF5407 domain-containing protein [Mycolicibacterium pallens]